MYIISLFISIVFLEDFYLYLKELVFGCMNVD